MAKQAKTAIKEKSNKSSDSKSWTKVIKATKNQKGAYIFKEAIIHKDLVKEHFASSNKK